MIINAKESDNLNIVFNTQTEGQLVVELPSCCVYKQKIKINRSNLVVKGNGSTIVWNDHNCMVPGFGTSASATLTVTGKNISFEDLTVENSFDYVGESKKPSNEDMAVRRGLQAVAVFTSPESDNISFNNCILKSCQDTLFADGITNYYNNCTIYGNIDFIFGRSYSIFDNCQIISVGEGFVTAPSTMATSPKGLCFVNCNLMCKDNVKEGSVYLGRPWHPDAKDGVWPYCEFTNCKLGNHINKDLWTRMHDKRGNFHYPSESRFFVN